MVTSLVQPLLFLFVLGPDQADAGVTWWGWHVPSVLEAGVILALGRVILGVAIWEFSTTE